MLVIGGMWELEFLCIIDKIYIVVGILEYKLVG